MGFTTLIDKTSETLKEQAQTISKGLGVELLPPLEPEIPDRVRLNRLKKSYPVRYEIYVALLRARKAGTLKELTNEERESFRVWLKAMNNLARYLTDKTQYAGAKLYVLQDSMMSEIYHYFEKGGREGYVSLPTQVGKTAIAAKLTAVLDLPTLSVTERRFDVEQMKKEYERFGVERPIGLVGGGLKQLDEQTTITTYASFRNLVLKGKISDKRYPLVILNEAHHALGQKTRVAVEKMKSSLAIGLTATADFSEEKGVWQVLPNKIYEMKVYEAVREGLLKNVRVYVAEVDMDLSSVKLRTQGDFDQGELERIINVAANNKGAVKLYKEMFAGQRAIVFCAGIEHAKAVANEFIAQGVSAAEVDGKTSEGTYKRIMERFDSGEIKVICCADLLIESFSQPKVSVCFNLRPTLSMRVAEQRGGRVLALNRENPDEEAIIVDFLYRGKKQLVTYFDVLGAARVTHAVSEAKESSQNDLPKPQKGLFIDGMRVHAEIEQVVLFFKEYKEKSAVIKLRAYEPSTVEEQVDTIHWDEMLSLTGRTISENCWRGRIPDEKIIADPEHVIVWTDITSMPLRKILDNPGWVEMSREDLIHFNPVEQYRGELKFLLTSLGNEGKTDAVIIRKMIREKRIRPVPIKKAQAILAWLLSSEYAQSLRQYPKNYAFLYIPTIDAKGTVGSICYSQLPYRKEDYTGYHHDIIWVMNQKNIKMNWYDADEQSIGIKIISNLE